MNDFKQEYSYYKEDVDTVLAAVLESGWYILGGYGKAFEEAFAAYIGTKYAIGVANGLEALQISLVALGIGPGDEVLTVSNTAVATVLAITNAGAAPVFVDVDEYGHMDPKKVEALITPKTKAILPVHLFGQCVDMDALQKIADKHKLVIVEDACQAAGASYKGKKAGSFGTVGCFSFYPTKNLGAYGDGGAITTDSFEIYQACLKLRNYGQQDRYKHEIKGINSRLDEMQAAILQVKLPQLDAMIAKRRAIAEIYLRELADLSEITLPKVREEGGHGFHLFAIEAKNRDELKNYLATKEIQSLIHYPIPVHKQECYAEFNEVSLPLTEKAAENLLSLPMNPFITEEEALKICEEIKAFYK